MTIDIPAIDVHAHYGIYQKPNQAALACDFASGDAQTVVQRALDVNVVTTIVSPLSGFLPRGEASACEGNREAADIVSKTRGLLQWVIVNPLEPASFAQATEMLQQPKCVGIKLHPEEHVYPITEHGDKLFDFAAQHDAIVLVHSGDPYSWPIDYLPFADKHPNVKLVLGHLGNGGGAAGDPTLQVRAIQNSVHGNIYTDTSSARSIMPNLIEWAVREIGAEKILYGTDTPLYHTAMQRARIDQADLSDSDKQKILRENAICLWSAELFEGNESC